MARTRKGLAYPDSDFSRGITVPKADEPVYLCRVRVDHRVKGEVREANAGKIIGYGFGALVLAVAIASPWYLRTWKATGSPLFPFYMSILERRGSRLGCRTL